MKLFRPDLARRLPKSTAALEFSAWTLFVGSCLVALTGCVTPATMSDLVVGPGFRPANVYRAGGKLPENARRLAVLPLAFDVNSADAAQGRETLEPILADELGRTGKFELIAVTPEQLRRWTGRSDWSAEDKLPADFFTKLREQTGCDAVLFARLTQFHAYPPLRLGWSLKLHSATEPQVLWAADEVFDASQPTVANAARRYQSGQSAAAPSLADSRSILNSPRRFGHYTVSALAATLPER